MHLARRGYVLLLLTAVLAVVAVWSDDRRLAGWWELSAGLLLLGLALESLLARRADRKSTRLNSSHKSQSRMPSSA